MSVAVGALRPYSDRRKSKRPRIPPPQRAVLRFLLPSRVRRSTISGAIPNTEPLMTNTRAVVLAAVGGAVVALGVMTAFAQKEYKSGIVWPEPVMVTPGKTDSDPPSDAIVLFDGKDLSKWTNG